MLDQTESLLTGSLDQQIAAACQLPKAIVEAEEAVAEARRALVSADSALAAEVRKMHADGANGDQRLLHAKRIRSLDAERTTASSRHRAAVQNAAAVRSGHQPQFHASIAAIERSMTPKIGRLIDQLDAALQMLVDVDQHASGHSLDTPAITRGARHAALHLRRLRIWLAGCQ